MAKWRKVSLGSTRLRVLQGAEVIAPGIVVDRYIKFDPFEGTKKDTLPAAWRLAL